MENDAQDAYVYMEDLFVGQTFSGGPVAVTAEEIVTFARQFDPQDFHTDPEKAKDTVFGVLVASGWHTAALTMKLLIATLPKMKGGMIGRTVENINWPRPVRPGDNLFYHGEILDIRASAGNPSRGVLRVKSTTTNQDGETVMEMTCVVFAPRRPAA